LIEIAAEPATNTSGSTKTPEKPTEPPPPAAKATAPTEQPGKTLGSEPQVEGQTGAVPEEPLKQQETSSNKVVVKGLFGQSSFYYTFLPTIILLFLLIYLGVKLYFTEKRQHLELEHLFDIELGTLSALESKMDLVDQKAEGKERVIQEIEEAKTQILSQAQPAKAH
jgi:hypothetical protein